MSLNTLIKGANPEAAKKNPEIIDYLTDETDTNLEFAKSRLGNAGDKDSKVAVTLIKEELQRRSDAKKRTSARAERAWQFITPLIVGLIVLALTYYLT